jgi:hypothetical protein
MMKKTKPSEILNQMNLLKTLSKASFASKPPANFFPNIPSGHRIKRFYKKVDIVEHPLSEEV